MDRGEHSKLGRTQSNSCLTMCKLWYILVYEVRTNRDNTLKQRKSHVLQQNVDWVMSWHGMHFLLYMHHSPCKFQISQNVTIGVYETISKITDVNLFLIFKVKENHCNIFCKRNFYLFFYKIYCVTILWYLFHASHCRKSLEYVLKLQ